MTVGQTAVLESALTSIEQSDLDRLEAVVRDGLGKFVEVGEALLKIRDSRLYRGEFDNFESYCRERWKMSRVHAHRLIESAEVVGGLLPVGNSFPQSERQARPLVQLDHSQRQEAWKAAVETAPGGIVTAKHVERIVNATKETGSVEAAKRAIDLKTCDVCGKQWVADIGFCPYCNLSPGARIAGLQQQFAKEKMDVHYSSESPEWYTPDSIIERTSKLMGGIDIDPCSNTGKPNVPAAEHFTKDDDGLSKEWAGKVYMNPPYGREIVEWIEKLKAEYDVGRTKEAIALVPSRTDTEWFRMLREFPRCFVTGRLNFSGHENSAPFPSVVIYLGKRAKKFTDIFSDIGDVYVLAK